MRYFLNARVGAQNEKSFHITSANFRAGSTIRRHPTITTESIFAWPARAASMPRTADIVGIDRCLAHLSRPTTSSGMSPGTSERPRRWAANGFFLNIIGVGGSTWNRYQKLVAAAVAFDG